MNTIHKIKTTDWPAMDLLLVAVAFMIVCFTIKHTW